MLKEEYHKCFHLVQSDKLVTVNLRMMMEEYLKHGPLSCSDHRNVRVLQLVFLQAIISFHREVLCQET